MKKLIAKLMCLSMLAVAPAVAQAADGAALWKAKKCAQCHGDDGKGQTKKGIKKGVKDMTNADWQKKVNDDAIKNAVMKGVDREEEGKKVKMKAQPDIKPDELAALLAYVRAFGKK